MKEAVAIFLAACLLIGFAVSLGYYMKNWRCGAEAEAIGATPWSYGPMQGCIVTYKGEKMSIERIGVRAFD